MSIEAIRAIVGTWASLIGPEFYKPYMTELQKSIEAHKKNAFVQFYSNKDYFEVFKKTPLDKLKAIYVTDTAKFDDQILYDIESELLGLSLPLTSQSNYDWLLAQGVMIFPRALSWSDKGGHKEWYNFTDQVLVLASQKKDLIIASDKPEVYDLLNYIGGECKKVADPEAWQYIDGWVEKNLGYKIQWEPNERTQ
jgi:hypothetical protein